MYCWEAAAADDDDNDDDVDSQFLKKFWL